MPQSQILKEVESVKNNSFVAAAELVRQSGYFADAYLVRHILDAMPGIVLVINRYRQIVFANRAFCDLSGQQNVDMLRGQLIGDVLACHVAYDAEAGCGTGESCETCGALAAMLSGTSGEGNVQECTISRRDGSVMQNLTLRVWTKPLNYAEENFVVLAGMDISHERRRLALERTFFHDILNLVGSIRGFAELMEIDDSIDKTEVSRRIQLASQRVIDEIDTQRVLLAVEKGELSLDDHVLNSKVVLNDILELYEGQDLARDRNLILSEKTANNSFVTDGTLLRRILGNMVKNALEATTSGGAVTLCAESDGDLISFWVHNEAAIPKAYQQRIFQRDFSTKGAGRGLGTYSMQLLGRFLSGGVTFKSEPDFGTQFVLSLPLVLPEAVKE
jgi:signal transduction histidine kinase